MPLQTLHTLSRNKAFDYKYADGGEIVVYPSDDDGHPQRKYALVITPFEQQLVRDGIRDAGTIVIGTSRDNPPEGSLGALLKAHGLVPQALSYLSAILVAEKYCLQSQRGNTLALAFRKKTVLIIDDDARTAELVARVLAQEGYNTLVADGPEEVLRALRLEESPIDLLLTDIVMPGMDGIELSRISRQIRPDLPILFMTGGDLAEHAGGPVLMKPFLPGRLLAAVSKIVPLRRGANAC